MSRENFLMGSKLLVVDDNPQNLDILIKHLKDYNVTIALNGEDAIKLAKETLPDIILQN